MGARIDSFSGSDAEYVQYLEHALISFRNHHQACTSCSPGFNVPLAPVPVPPSTGPQLPTSDSGGLNHTFVYVDPKSCQKDHPKSKRRKSPLPLQSWQVTANGLIESTPTAEQWWNTIRDTGIDQMMRNPIEDPKALEYILGSSQDFSESASIRLDVLRSSLDISEPEDNVITRLQGYAHGANARERSAGLTLMLAHFQKFLVLCACKVLLQMEIVSQKHIYDIVKVCVGRDSEDWCQRILRTVVYLNKLIDFLDVNGWNNCASQLLFICKHSCRFCFIIATGHELTFIRGNRPPSAYYPFAAHSKASFEHFTTQLLQPEFTNGVQRGGSLQTFVPFLVSQLLKSCNQDVE